jgi:hypothetical protein
MLKKIFIPIVLLASFSFGFKTNVDTLKLRKFKSNHITYVKTSDSILDTTGIIYDNKFTCFPGNILGLNTSNPMLSSYELYNNYFRSSATDSNVFKKKVVAKDTLFALSHLQVNGEIYNQGITWTSRTSAADNSWRSICYGNGLFVACASTGTGNRIMTSPNGITWTSRTPAVDNDWRSICYGNGLFVACASTGTGNRIMTSPDGITWTSRTSAADNSWMSICYGNGVFVAISFSGTGNRVMTSGKSTKLITSDNNIYHGGIISTGTVSTDSLYSINGIKSNRGTFSSNIGVGSNSSLAAVDISYGGSTLALGGDLDAYTRTDNTDKFSKISLVHYDIDEEPICVAYMACGSGSVLNVGGGASSLNAIMGIDFYTADAVNTLTGTKRVGIASDGSVTIGAPTGGGKGAGTINAVAVYDDNVLLTGYVFDKYFNQNFDISKWNKNDTNNSLNPIRQPATEFIKHSDVCFNRKLYWNYIREKRVLPTMADVEDSSRIPSIGSLAQRLWETAEIQAIHTLQQDILIDSLTARIIALENKSNP